MLEEREFDGWADHNSNLEVFPLIPLYSTLCAVRVIRFYANHVASPLFHNSFCVENLAILIIFPKPRDLERCKGLRVLQISLQRVRGMI